MPWCDAGSATTTCARSSGRTSYGSCERSWGGPRRTDGAGTRLVFGAGGGLMGTSDRTDEAFPKLSAATTARLVGLCSPREVRAGDALFSAGDRDYDFFYLESAAVDVVRNA